MGESLGAAESNCPCLYVSSGLFLMRLKHLFLGKSVSSQRGLSKPRSQISWLHPAESCVWSCQKVVTGFHHFSSRSLHWLSCTEAAHSVSQWEH